MKIDDSFFGYMDMAFKHYKVYAKKEKEGDLSFEEFLLLILTWKLEEVLERLEKLQD